MHLPPPSLQHINNCRFSSWFAKCSKFSLNSRYLALDSVFVHYLLSDGIVLPKPLSDESVPSYHAAVDRFDEVDDPDTSNDDSDSEDPDPPSFPDLQQAISDIIKDFNGAVFPKLNWSSPK
ncbi:hypothetical protein HK096_009872, partial [Nowakowskiella sp. JEL0078]